MSPLASIGHYRVVSGSERAEVVAALLSNDPVPYLVVRTKAPDGRASWHIFETDERLLERLTGTESVERRLALSEPVFNTIVREQTRRRSLNRRGPALPQEGPPERIFVDAQGTMRSLVGKNVFAEAEATIYATLDTQAKSVAPDEVVEFKVRLAANAMPGLSTAFDVQFEGDASVPVHVSVSSRDFAMPAGTSWIRQIPVGRDLPANPVDWNFTARALGERSQYLLRVSFLVRGHVVGSLVATLSRTGKDALPTAMSSSGTFAPFPAAALEPAFTLNIRVCGEKREIIALRGGAEVERAPWDMKTDVMFFAELQGARSLEEISEIGAALLVDLPAAIRDLLTKDTSEAPVHIVAGAPYAPFELTEVRGELMGARRPVLRWHDDVPQVIAASVPVNEVLCVRPEYGGDDHLPSAALEEQFLEERLGKIRRAPTEVMLRPFLENPAIRTIHFAGHAQSDPALLKFGDGISVRPVFFRMSSPLMSQGHPFFFLNGCHAGTARPARPAAHANMVKALLVNGACGVVAPAIEVQSQGALNVTRTFYERIQEGDSVGQALLAIRRGGLSADPANAATHWAYLAFASSAMRLTWPKR